MELPPLLPPDASCPSICVPPFCGQPTVTGRDCLPGCVTGLTSARGLEAFATLAEWAAVPPLPLLCLMSCVLVWVRLVWRGRPSIPVVRSGRVLVLWAPVDCVPGPDGGSLRGYELCAGSHVPTVAPRCLTGVWHVGICPVHPPATKLSGFSLQRPPQKLIFARLRRKHSFSPSCSAKNHFRPASCTHFVCLCAAFPSA